jgi:DNA-binding SARP family transcriptional activator
MDFRILGPLEVWDERGQLELRGARQRALLALLLLNRNRAVSSDRLIEELWPEAPPRNAANALQAAVSRVRRAIGARRVRAQAPGYVIALEPEELDLDRFEQLAAAGRAALAAGDAAAAAEALAEALSQWRGPPLAEFAYEPFAAPEIARLEELRLAALEHRIDADLALGRHR